MSESGHVDPSSPALNAADAVGGSLVYRHRWPVRLWHWLNAVALVGLFMSGLMIFNAHPRLYWGHYGANPDPAWLEISGNRGYGELSVGSLTLVTEGVLGRSAGSDGMIHRRAFPEQHPQHR